MYLGSDFHRFWAKCGGLGQHPEDVPFLKDIPFDAGFLPCPFDGPLENAKVVICLANPNYGRGADHQSLNALVQAMRSGEEHLPEEFEAFYRRKTGPIGLPLENLRKLVAILNVCPYPSARMDDRMVRSVAGLPSVWQAQQYLRQVLIPRAQTGNIYLIFIRKLQLWGVTPGMEVAGNLRVVLGREMSGVMPRELGQEIREWLIRKGHAQSE
jgi:hypothetical protein